MNRLLTLVIFIFLIGFCLNKPIKSTPVIPVTTVAATVGCSGFMAFAFCTYNEYVALQKSLNKPCSNQGFISYAFHIIKKVHHIKNGSLLEQEQYLRPLLLVSELFGLFAIGNYAYQKPTAPVKSCNIDLKKPSLVAPDFNRNLYDVVIFGNAAEVKRIFDNFAVGVDIKISPYEDYRGDLMTFAIEHDNASVVQALLERKYPRKKNYLKQAIELQKPASIAYLLTQQQSQDYLDEALIAASLWSDIQMLEMLIEKGARIDVTGSDGMTPFAAAVVSGHHLVVDWLYKKIMVGKSDAQKKNFLEQTYTHAKKTVLDSAIEHGHWSIVHWLGKHGAQFTQASLLKAHTTGAQYIIQEVTKYVKK